MLPDGLYLNLPMRLYRDDPALGGSDLGAILTNPVQWHARERNQAWRELNPPTTEESAATRFGTALHTMLLEPDEFDARYFEDPEPPNLPETKRDIADGLKRIGVSLPSMGEDLLTFQSLARQHGLSTMDDWRAMVAAERGERETLSKSWRVTLELIRRTFERHPEAPKFLSKGLAEVSVFWTDPNGVRLKCRYDWLRVRTVADVKTYSLREGDESVQGFVSAAERYGYDFSAAHYMHMRTEAVPALVDNQQVFDASPMVDGRAHLTLNYPADDDLFFLRRVAAEREPSWWWIACMTMGYPEIDCIEFPMSLLQFQSAAYQVDQAKATYLEYRNRFGDEPDVAWVADRPRVRLTDAAFMSARSRGRGEIRWEAG